MDETENGIEPRRIGRIGFPRDDFAAAGFQHLASFGDEVRQQVISKPVAAGGGATALYKVTPFDGGFGGDDAKDELENTAL